MDNKPTYEELEKRVKDLEQEKIQLLKGTSGLISGVISEDTDLKSIIDIEEVQSILDDFHSLTQMVTAILDTKGEVLESTGWQDLCVKFHRVNAETSNNCTESDLYLAKKLKPGEFIDYKCKNGLWDVVTPLYIGTKHLGNIFTGQFFYDDDDVDEEYFVKQSEKYGFDKDSYLDAFRRIPRYSREKINHLMNFLVKFTSYISKIGIMNIELTKEISERKKVDKERVLLNAELETKNEELEQVLYVASHDLRSPLVNIDGYSRELEYSIKELQNKLSVKSLDNVMNDLSPILDDDIPEALRFIRTSAAKMDTLLSGLLRLSRTGRAGLKIESLDMNQIISKVIASNEFKIRETNVEIISHDLPPCKGDAIQMDQIFSNLLGNALKCLDADRKGKVKISGQIIDDQSVYRVEDNGIGIEAMHLDKIFEIFHQLNPTQNKGEGLGLTIVKRILAKLDGTIRVESTIGKGSCFYVSMPIGNI